MLKFVVGHSNDPDSEFAVSEVLEQIHTTLVGASPQAGILFAAIDFDHVLILDRIMKAFPDIALIGGTTDGEVSSVLGFEQDSLTLMVFCADDITITAGIGRGVSKNALAACQSAIQQASAAHIEAIQFCISLPESLTTSGELILDGLKQTLGERVPIFGGLTADQWRSQQTYQFFHTEVCSDAVPVLLFSGPILFSYGVASGWQPVGTPGRVPKAANHVVYEIDHQPAFDFYQRYLGILLHSWQPGSCQRLHPGSSGFGATISNLLPQFQSYNPGRSSGNRSGVYPNRFAQNTRFYENGKRSYSSDHSLTPQFLTHG
jgi:hypothetical protein